jgi:hypothetical protein
LLLGEHAIFGRELGKSRGIVRLIDGVCVSFVAFVARCRRGGRFPLFLLIGRASTAGQHCRNGQNSRTEQKLVETFVDFHNSILPRKRVMVDRLAGVLARREMPWLSAQETANKFAG